MIDRLPSGKARIGAACWHGRPDMQLDDAEIGACFHGARA